MESDGVKNSDQNKSVSPKPKRDLVAATHILKKHALRRYREKHATDADDIDGAEIDSKHTPVNEHDTLSLVSESGAPSFIDDLQTEKSIAINPKGADLQTNTSISDGESGKLSSDKIINENLSPVLGSENSVVSDESEKVPVLSENSEQFLHEQIPANIAPPHDTEVKVIVSQFSENTINDQGLEQDGQKTDNEQTEPSNHQPTSVFESQESLTSNVDDEKQTSDDLEQGQSHDIPEKNLFEIHSTAHDFDFYDTSPIGSMSYKDTDPSQSKQEGTGFNLQIVDDVSDNIPIDTLDQPVLPHPNDIKSDIVIEKVTEQEEERGMASEEADADLKKGKEDSDVTDNKIGESDATDPGGEDQQKTSEEDEKQVEEEKEKSDVEKDADKSKEDKDETGTNNETTEVKNDEDTETKEGQDAEVKQEEVVEVKSEDDAEAKEGQDADVKQEEIVEDQSEENAEAKKDDDSEEKNDQDAEIKATEDQVHAEKDEPGEDEVKPEVLESDDKQGEVPAPSEDVQAKEESGAAPQVEDGTVQQDDEGPTPAADITTDDVKADKDAQPEASETTEPQPAEETENVVNAESEEVSTTDKVADGDDVQVDTSPPDEQKRAESSPPGVETQEAEDIDAAEAESKDPDAKESTDNVPSGEVAEEGEEKGEEDEEAAEEEDVIKPPIVEGAQKPEEAPEEEKVESEEEIEEGPPKDFFYDLEEYQSTSRVSTDSGIPGNLLQFYHSFGYDCCKRANLHLLRGPTIVFAAGNLVHILNLATGEHRFLRSSSGGGIGAITVHPSGNFFVVAEKGVKPHILIYEFPSLKLYRILRDGTEEAFSFVDFSPKGDLLASVGSKPDYMLTVWAWEKEKIMLRSKAFSQEIYRVTFSPEQEGQLTSCGTTHIRFWKMAFTFTGLKLKGELGRFGKTSLSDIDGYIQLPDGKVLSGCDWGNMLLWDGGLIKVEICRKNLKPCHHGSVQQLVIDEGELITIGLDGYVRVWEMEAIDSADTTDESDHFEIEPMNELKVGNDVQLTCMVKAQPEDDPSMEEGASIWFAQDSNGGIWKLDLSFSHTTKPPEKLYSFTAGDITGLAPSPSSHLMAATGDAYVRVYDYLTKDLLCQFHSPQVQSKGTSILWPNKVVDPKGTTVIVGFSDGIMRLLNLRNVDDTNELALVQALKPHSDAITAMSFDNTGEILATGSKDKTIFFFAVGHGSYEPIGFVDIPGEVTGIQWAPGGFPDNTLLVSCSNGKVVEVTAPSLSAVDTTHTYKLSDVPMRLYTFQSIKSRLRRDEERERKEIAKAKRRKERERELKRRRDRGEEISDEDAATFLEEDPEAEDEEEEEPLFFPAEPSPILKAFYVTPGRFIVSIGEYDAGYLYECVFPESSALNAEEEATEPVRAVPVKESNDVPITTIRFSEDRHKLFVGFQNGLIRVYPLEDDPEKPFDLDMLSSHWNLNMHDNQHGHVTAIEESHDGCHVFSSGGDGNLFGFHSLAHEEIVKSMQGQRAKLPSPHKRSADERLIDDIDDPNAYSIEDAKLKAEHDKMMREAEAKKLMERKKINKLRKTFLQLLQRNSELPSHVQLKREEFELDPSIRMKMVKQTHERIERVKLEMQWDKEKLALAHRKIENRFRSQLECDRIVVHSFNSSHTVASYRVAKLPDEYYSLKQTVEQRVRAASLASEGGLGTIDGIGASLPSERGNETDDAADDASFLNDAKRKAKQTILHGRQAEKVAKAIKKAEEAKHKHEKRQTEWQELFKSKPDKKYEDPADVSAIKEAQANMGDFKLKTSSDYVVPEHLRMDTEKKRYQILILQGLIHRAKSDFNEKLVHLRDTKLDLITEMKNYSQELKAIQSKMSKEEKVRLLSIPNPHPDEEPHKKYEFTRQTLLKFEEEEKEREIAEAKKKRKGDGGLFGGFGDEAPPEAPQIKDLKHSSRKSASSVSSSVRSRVTKEMLRSESCGPTALEQQIAQIEKIRFKHQRDRLLRTIKEKMTLFDAELRLLRHNKINLDVDLKMADLRHVTLLEELLLLKEYEKRETTLSGRVVGKRTELAEINGKAAEMQVRLEGKKRDIERLADREKALYASFTSSLGDNNKFADFLNKVFKKKIKRAKKKVVQEGDEEDSDVSSSDESDWSSEEEDDDSVEGGFDDSVCPPGCEQQLFDSTLVLRERRLDLEESLVEEKKLAESLKKDVDALGKKAKVMESQLKNALDDLEAFQVEKQGKLNELDVVVPLRFHQVEHVSNATIPSDLSSCLVFANSSLTGLQRRIKELQQEKGEQRKFYKEARQQHVHLIKSGRMMEERIRQLEEKCEHAMMLKFGRVVDLDRLDSVTVNKNVEELKEQVRLNEVKNARYLLKLHQHIDDLRDRITNLTRDNTQRLERLNVLVNDNTGLEEELDHRQRTMELEERGKKKSEIREQHRLVQLVQLQAQEIQALKEEIGLLSRKGGHILPPAQPPLGQDPDVM